METETNKSDGYIYCHTCKKQTRTCDLVIFEQEDSYGDCFYLKGKCLICKIGQSRRIGKKLPSGITLQTPSDKLLEHLSTLNKQKKGSALSNASSVPDTANVEPAPAVIATAVQDDYYDGEGFWDSIKNFGKKPSFMDTLGNTAAKATKSLVGGIPIVGDLLNQTGLTDKAIDFVSENIWQPFKKWIGGSLTEKQLREKIETNDRELSDLAEKALELEIKKGEGIIPKYLGQLRQGSQEDKTLAHILMKTLVKPKFYKFLKDEKIPSTTSILEAMMKYKSKSKNYKNDEDKALNILSGLGYDVS